MPACVLRPTVAGCVWVLLIFCFLLRWFGILDIGEKQQFSLMAQSEEAEAVVYAVVLSGDSVENPASRLLGNVGQRMRQCCR